jgi:hypothetical protein
MDRETSSKPQYTPVTVDVPEDRVAEFHAFFARFLAAPTGRGRGGRHGRPYHGRHRHGHGHGPGCTARHQSAQPTEPATSTEL